MKGRSSLTQQNSARNSFFHSLLVYSALGLCLMLSATQLAAQDPISIPPLKSAVTDLTQSLKPQTKQELTQIIQQVWRQGEGPQIAVLLLPTLNQEPIEAFSIRVADIWKLGDVKRDDGVLLLIVTTDRQLRIEVGAGLEGELTDLASNRIIQDQMIPLLQRSNLDASVIAGVRGIVQAIDPQLANTLKFPQLSGDQGARQQSGQPMEWTWWKILIFLAMAFFFLFTPIGRMMLIAMLLSGRGGGGRGGGGFGGGGFGGGGGGFSGGGASGRW
jgi:uncharacterized protein